MSVWVMPMVAEKNAVSVPMMATAIMAEGARSKMKCDRETM